MSSELYSPLKQINLKCYTIRATRLETKLQELTINKSQFTAAQKHTSLHHQVIIKINI